MTKQASYRPGRHVVPAPHAHSAFATNYRRSVLDNAMPRSCQQAMRGVRADFGAEPAEFNGQDNHVHLLVTYPAQNRDLGPGQLTQRSAGPAPARAIHRPGEQVLNARALLVTVALRCLPWRRAATDPQAIHRTAEPAGPTPP